MAIKIYTLAQQTVATAGTAQQVSATPTRITAIVFQATKSNTGNIIVGDENVSSSRGIVLEPGQSVSYNQDHEGREGSDEFYLSDFWIDATVNGSTVKITYKAVR